MKRCRAGSSESDEGKLKLFRRAGGFRTKDHILKEVESTLGAGNFLRKKRSAHIHIYFLDAANPHKDGGSNGKKKGRLHFEYVCDQLFAVRLLHKLFPNFSVSIVVK